jgi:DNA-binding CsgD family transcriptional regulator/tetratricopeptide (TPR) repeat protein
VQLVDFPCGPRADDAHRCKLRNLPRPAGLVAVLEAVQSRQYVTQEGAAGPLFRVYFSIGSQRKIVHVVREAAVQNRRVTVSRRSTVQQMGGKRMQLLERDGHFEQLATLVAAAARGQGFCALVLGEAGIGKTVLLRSFCAALPSTASLLWGACEPLFTPRPLGPIVDLADQLPPGLANRLHAGHDRDGLFHELLGHLRERGRPTLMVIEDAHWADESTLDWIKYAGRRIDRTPALLVLTVREDELGIQHPLRKLMDELPAASTRQIHLAPLSLGAIGELARTRGRDAVLLERQTGGNPFYLTELLAVEDDAVPGSIRDAVLARVARLSAAARRVVECVAIEPGRLEIAAIEACEPGARQALSEATDSGVLHADEHGLAFRHEIARQCVESSLAAARRNELHVRLLQHLQSGSGTREQLARQVHHAHAAGMKRAVADLAPRAAEQAARVGAHREAAALYRVALALPADPDLDARAELLEAAARELQVTGALHEAIELRTQALALRRTRGDARQIGVNLRLIGVLQQQASADIDAYLHQASAAADALAPLGPSGELAKAYATVSHAYCLRSEYDTAIDWGRRAVELADRFDDPAARALALNRLGSARVCRVNDPEGRAQVEQALALAIEHRFEELAADIFVSLQTLALNHHDHDYALEVGARGIEFCQARDMDGFVGSLRSRRAYSLVHLGRWEEGEREYAALEADRSTATPSRNSAHFALQRLAVRRGSAQADDYWRLAQTRMRDLAVGYRLPAIAAACAEAAWLRGDLADAIELARHGLDEARRTEDGRLAGPLLVWLRRLGATVAVVEATLLPAYALELSGALADAAREWERLRNPYELALALLFGDAGQVRSALAVFEQLGAQRPAQRARIRLRELGTPSDVPRRVGEGVRAPLREGKLGTGSDPHGLTPRERDVFELLVLGLSNEAIARRLRRSERTVEQHVSAVLAKAGVRSRLELIASTARSAAGAS